MSDPSTESGPGASGADSDWRAHAREPSRAAMPWITCGSDECDSALGFPPGRACARGSPPQDGGYAGPSCPGPVRVAPLGLVPAAHSWYELSQELAVRCAWRSPSSASWLAMAVLRGTLGLRFSLRP